MRDQRVTILLQRELDGCLTEVERAELDRIALRRPEARRERAAWRRMFAGMAQTEAGSLRVDAMAASITRELDRRRPQARVRRWALGATLVAAAFALFVLTPAPEPPAPAEVAQLPNAPVEISLGVEDLDETDVPAVTIFF